VFRPLAAAHETSPAALRVQVSASESGPRVDILKCRGRMGENLQATLLSA
jgi:hypothetical protein